ncbi:MAG: hypothetical protein DRJ01_05270 [Bacteroidetes bacterium]|nr:MAG: hypothetical protein DRJ01_05270 [Bacteroidota bacterium]
MNTNAQEQLKAEKRIYISPNGRMYINKSLPVYLRIATSPEEGAKSYLLKSEETKKFSNPMYFDTEGYNTVRSPSEVDTVTKKIVYPLHDIIFEVYADSRTPRTNIKFGEAKKYIHNNEVFLTGNVNISLSATDAMSGVQSTYYSIDGADYIQYSKPIIFDKEKKYKLKYYSVDNVGNVEQVITKEYNIDLTYPETKIEIIGDKYNNIISARSKIKLSSTDNISGVSNIYYTIDSGTKRIYKYPILAKYLKEGEHIITYYANDKVNNKEPEKKYEFYLDKTSPILVEEVIGNSFLNNGKEYSSGRTQLKLTAVDNKADVKEIYYSLNNGEYKKYEKPVYLSNVSGSLSIKSYAVDNVNNRSVASEQSTRNKTSYIDLSGPKLSYYFRGKFFKISDTAFVNKNTKVFLKARDVESGLNMLNYKLDNSSEKPYTKPFSITDDKVHSVQIIGYDNVNNSNTLKFNLSGDNVGPDIFPRFSIVSLGKKNFDDEMIDVYPAAVVLFLSATDRKVPIDNIYYSINGAKENVYTRFISNFRRGKKYTVKLRAVDLLGNVSTDSIKFAIDNTGPKIFARFTTRSFGKKEFNGKQIDIYPTQVALYLSVTNTTVAYDRIYYSVNGSAEKIYQGKISGFKGNSNILLKIRAVDKLGNQTTKEIQFATQN